SCRRSRRRSFSARSRPPRSEWATCPARSRWREPCAGTIMARWLFATSPSHKRPWVTWRPRATPRPPSATRASSTRRRRKRCARFPRSRRKPATSRARSQRRSLRRPRPRRRSPFSVLRRGCSTALTPCNANHRKLAQKVAEGVRAGGGTPIEFNTISVTDGIAMGTEGMKASLISRDWIADSVELVTRGHLLDGLVTLSGCDKTIPAMVMAMARLDLPSVMLYGGSIMYGEYKGKRMTVQDIFEAIGARNAGKIDDKELHAVEGASCPGQGAWGG